MSPFTVQTGSAHDLRSRDDLPERSIIFGCSEAMQAIVSRLEAIAASCVPVLIQGENGTGKDVLARLIHNLSPMADGVFARLNCSALSETALDETLSANSSEVGTTSKNTFAEQLSARNGCTLFVDEIAELALPLQRKLLGLLQDRGCSPSATQGAGDSELRVICATSRKLETEVAAGRFRQDLLYRISVVALYLPALRERAADIPDMVEHFRRLYNSKFGRSTPAFSEQILEAFVAYHWPGNIRQLENLVKRHVIMNSESAIREELTTQQTFRVPDVFCERALPLKSVTKQMVREIEREIILRALEENQWNRKQAARALNISYRALLYKVKEAGLMISKTETAR